MTQWSKTKICPDCKEDKPRGDFHERPSRTDGLATYCDKCSRLRNKANYAKCDKPARRLANKANYAKCDKTARTRVHREWVRRHKDHIRAYKASLSLKMPLAKVKAILARGVCEICGRTT